MTISPEPSASGFRRHVERNAVVGRRTVLFGAAGAVFLAACGGDSTLLDEAASSTDVSVDDTADTTGDTTADTSADAGTADGAAIDEMVVQFTYTMAANGKQENPYIAVWVEDALGDLVDTVAVWFQQGSRGTRWLSDLAAWYADVAAAGTDYSSASGATRAAGMYSVSWQGVDGTGVPAGDYVVNVESAREDGPTSLIRQAVTVTAAATSVEIADDGELSAAAVELVA